MARGIHTKKRSRPSSFSKRGTSKRRRTVRRGRKTSAFTSQSGTGGGLKFKGRRTSRSAYNRLLWNSSLLLTHYRSNSANTFTHNTPATASTMAIAALPALQVGGGPFWTAGGGAINPDASNTLPTFTGNILIRGGTIGLRLANTYDTTDANRCTIQGTVFLIKTSKGYVGSAIPGTVNVGWDPTFVQDFDTKFGKIVYRRNFLLRDADTSQIEYRHKIRKIDEADYLVNVNQYIWLVLAGTVDINSVRSTTYTAYYNISFTGDGV